MASYHTFATDRLTAPDMAAVLLSVRSALSDSSVVIGGYGPTYTGKKATPWSSNDIASAQTVLDTAPALTAQRLAQNELDALSIVLRALVLALVDPINQLRTQPTQAFPAVTPAQAFQAIRDKAATL